MTRRQVTTKGLLVGVSLILVMLVALAINLASAGMSLADNFEITAFIGSLCAASVLGVVVDLLIESKRKKRLSKKD